MEGKIKLGHITGWSWSNGIAAIRRGEWDYVLCKCYFHISWSANHVAVHLFNHDIIHVTIEYKFIYYVLKCQVFQVQLAP